MSITGSPFIALKPRYDYAVLNHQGHALLRTNNRNEASGVAKDTGGELIYFKPVGAKNGKQLWQRIVLKPYGQLELKL